MKFRFTTATLALAFALAVVAGFGLSGRVSAQTAACGPESKWTGQICIGPRGKAYCPEGMTMEGQTCVGPQAGVSNAAPLQPTGAATESDHQLIIKMLTALTNQVSAQQAQINQEQEALKALQVTVTLTMNSADKARVSATNAESATANIQTAVTSMQSTLTNTAANVATTQARVVSLQSSVDQLNTQAVAQAATQKDVQHRQAIMCHMLAEIDPNVPNNDSATNGHACDGTYWYPDVTKKYLERAIPFKY